MRNFWREGYARDSGLRTDSRSRPARYRCGGVGELGLERGIGLLTCGGGHLFPLRRVLPAEDHDRPSDSGRLGRAYGVGQWHGDLGHVVVADVVPARSHSDNQPYSGRH
jgi:hypothetical protein